MYKFYINISDPKHPANFLKASETPLNEGWKEIKRKEYFDRLYKVSVPQITKHEFETKTRHLI